MDSKLAGKNGLLASGFDRGYRVAGCRPDETGIRPVVAVQVVICCDIPDIADGIPNAYGAGIAIGRPFGMSGARLVCHALIEDKGAASGSPPLRSASQAGSGDWVAQVA